MMVGISSVKHFYHLVIQYTNGSEDRLPFDQFHAVRDFYQHCISYSGGRVKRVEVEFHDSKERRAIWDITWDEYSQAKGLTS